MPPPKLADVAAELQIALGEIEVLRVLVTELADVCRELVRRDDGKPRAWLTQRLDAVTAALEE